MTALSYHVSAPAPSLVQYLLFSPLSCKWQNNAGESSFSKNTARTFGNSIFIYGTCLFINTSSYSFSLQALTCYEGTQSSLIELSNSHTSNGNSMPFGFGGAVSVDSSLMYLSILSIYHDNVNGFGGMCMMHM